jgi:hypothetical protein
MTHLADITYVGLGCIKIDNPQKKDHADPPTDCHGLCLANPCRAAFIGGVGASKTTTLLNTIFRCSEWKKFDHRSPRIRLSACAISSNSRRSC